MIRSESAFTPLLVPRVGESPIDVRSETDKARTRGYADGFAQGRQVALEEARVQQTAEHRRLQNVHEEYVQRRESVLNALRLSRSALDQRVEELSALSADRIEELALELATAILGIELSEPARSAGHAIRRAMAETPVDRWTRVAFSEQDSAILLEDDETAEMLRGIEIMTSPAVDAGGAIVEIENGAVDTRITHALRRAGAALRHGSDQDSEVLG